MRKDIQHKTDSMPKWAEYEVLAYKVSTRRMVEIAFWSYKDLEEREEFKNGIESKDKREQTNWIHKGVRDALSYLLENTRIPFRFYTQQFLKNNPAGFLLAFASSIKLPPWDDRSGEFFVDTVHPDQRINDIRHFATLIRCSKELPYWYIPDEAHDLDVIKQMR